VPLQCASGIEGEEYMGDRRAMKKRQLAMATYGSMRLGPEP
jgi:hypothetical protein